MTYYCKYCGFEHHNLKHLLFCSCSKSPTKHHVAYEGHNTDPFVCKHCGFEHKSLKHLTFCSCHKSPTKHHEPL